MINGRTRLLVVANGTMTGQRYIDEVLVPPVRLFRGAVGDNLFLWTTTQHVIEHSLFGLSGQRGYSTSRMASAFSRSNPIENVWDAFGRQVAGRNYPPTNKNPLSVHSQRNGINCLNSCWIMLCKVWYDVWNVASDSTVDISRTDTFL
ncbi:hypothetical protein TNCV_2984631 [Trichonephila clavipes]|nr:hypothetical protein TNCV_2984631 [Trichonephila clavipes]